MPGSRATRCAPSTSVRPIVATLIVSGCAVEGRVDDFELELRRADGRPMWALVSARAVTFGGQPAMLTAVTDISERKAIEEALRASEARLAAFMENAPVGMYLKDLEGRYVLANPEMSKVFARPAEDMLGLTAADTEAEHDPELIAEHDRAVLETGRAQIVEEYAPGLDAYSWSLVIRFPIRDGQGRITHIGGFDVDITRQKATEQQPQGERTAVSGPGRGSPRAAGDPWRGRRRESSSRVRLAKRCSGSLASGS